MRVVVLIPMLVACGRIGFETQAQDPGDAIGDSVPLVIDAPHATLAFVQANANHNDGGLQAATGFLSPVIAGDLLVIETDYNATFLPAIDDDLGSMWHLLPAYDGNGGFNRNVIAWTIAPSSGADVVRSTIPSTTQFFELRIHEYAGGATFDNQVGATGTGPPCHTTITTGAANSLVFVVTIFNGPAPPAAGPGFTQRTAFVGDYTGDAILGAPGSYAVDVEFSGSTAWTTTTAAFVPI